MSSIKLIYFQPIARSACGRDPPIEERRACGRDPPQKKEKIKHYMLCQSYPQAQEGQINSLLLTYPIHYGIRDIT
jgi:hypothetical protein